MKYKTQFQCQECARVFTRSISMNTVSVKCPNCHSYDTWPTEVFGKVTKKELEKRYDHLAEKFTPKKNPPKYKLPIIQYSPSLRITNTEQLPKGTGANYLLCILGESQELIAVSFHRNIESIEKEAKKHYNPIIVSFIKKNPPHYYRLTLNQQELNDLKYIAARYVYAEIIYNSLETIGMSADYYYSFFRIQENLAWLIIEGIKQEDGYLPLMGGTLKEKIEDLLEKIT